MGLSCFFLIKTVQTSISAARDRFLGFCTFVSASDVSLNAIMEEVIVLSTNMCGADAAHSNIIIETIQIFRALCVLLLNELGEKMRRITDRASVESCKRTLKKVVNEVLKVWKVPGSKFQDCTGGGTRWLDATVSLSRPGLATTGWLPLHQPAAAGMARSVLDSQTDDRCANPLIYFRSFHAPHPSKIPPN
jgi:hypothetical protein